MKFLFRLLPFLFSFAIAPALSVASAAAHPPPSPDPLATLRAGHPRLLFTPQDWEAFDLRVKNRKQDPQFEAIMSQLEKNAREFLSAPALTHKKTGRRLLAVSREALRRITTLAIVHRATRDDAFARRAEKEMLAVAAFADWNPSHFLDVGEMTAALALGYDWLHDKLAPESRAKIRRAIVDKGITQGIDKKFQRNGWQTNTNNWNQVCWGGLTLGALAIAEDEPALARATLERARAGIVHGLEPYAPDGVYPEGPSYWGYGTTYQVLMIAALESALGTDWDLPRSPGFMESARVQLHLTGPTGYMFNFSDCGNARLYDPVLYWFAKKLNNPLLAVPPDSSAGKNRFQPLVALWWPEKGLPAASANNAPTTSAAPDMPLAWKGEGINPVAIFRSSWTDPNALWLAVKAGAASANHGHMDAGSFVLEADGVRWAIDLGMQQYESLESKGIKLFDRGQDGQRWSVFRLNNFSHNTLTIGGRLHKVDGRAEIEQVKRFPVMDAGDSADTLPNVALLDMSPVFAGQAKGAHREFLFDRQKREVYITDIVGGLAPGAEVRWAMVTKAKVEISQDGITATLRQDDKTLRASLPLSVPLSVRPPPPAGTIRIGGRVKTSMRFEVIPADPPKNNYDATNPNTRILIVRATADAKGDVPPIIVKLRAGEAVDTAKAIFAEPAAAVK